MPSHHKLQNALMTLETFISEEQDKAFNEILFLISRIAKKVAVLDTVGETLKDKNIQRFKVLKMLAVSFLNYINKTYSKNLSVFVSHFDYNLSNDDLSITKKLPKAKNYLRLLRDELKTNAQIEFKDQLITKNNALSEQEETKKIIFDQLMQSLTTLIEFDEDKQENLPADLIEQEKEEIVSLNENKVKTEEILSSAIKHAFPENMMNAILVECHQQAMSVLLTRSQLINQTIDAIKKFEQPEEDVFEFLGGDDDEEASLLEKKNETNNNFSNDLAKTIYYSVFLDKDKISPQNSKPKEKIIFSVKTKNKAHSLNDTLYDSINLMPKPDTTPDTNKKKLPVFQKPLVLNTNQPPHAQLSASVPNFSNNHHQGALFPPKITKNAPCPPFLADENQWNNTHNLSDAQKFARFEKLYLDNYNGNNYLRSSCLNWVIPNSVQQFYQNGMYFGLTNGTIKTWSDVKNYVLTNKNAECDSRKLIAKHPDLKADLAIWLAETAARKVEGPQKH